MINQPQGLPLRSAPSSKEDKDPNPPQPKLIDPLDAPTIRQNVYDKALSAIREIQPVSNKQHTLRLVNPVYADPDYFDIAAQKKAVLANRGLYRRVRGTWELVDNATGNVIDSKAGAVARIPFVSNAGTIIDNGTKYTVTSQQRLSSGAFVRRKNNGEIEAHINALPGQGNSHRYYLNPEKSKFYVTLDQANLPIMPLMQALGANANELRQAWGDDVYLANKADDDGRSLNRYYEKFVPTKQQNPSAPDAVKYQQVAEAVSSIKLDPQVTKRTLGKPYDSLSKEAILDLTRKVLSVSKGEAETDDRDSLVYQRFLGVDDLIAEFIRKDFGNARRNLLFKASKKGNIQGIPSGALDDQVRAVLLHSGLGNSLEETSPLEIIDKLGKVTRMGIGGISSSESIPDEARSVSPSHLGMLDFIRTPESTRAGVDLYFSYNSRRGEDGQLYAPFRNLKTGKEEMLSARSIGDTTVAFPGEMRKDKPYVDAMDKGKMRTVPREQVAYELPHMEFALSPLAALIPLKSAMKPHRSVMASRMLSQALPLVGAEAPLVQTAIPGTEGRESFDEKLGSFLGAIKADKPGRVIQATDDEIVIKHEDGTETRRDLYNHMPMNRKTFWHNKRMVERGQWVEPGQLLATSNYTDTNGTTAIGRNLRVGYIAYKGLNFEDASVISESAAAKLTSENMVQSGMDFEKDIVNDKNMFLSAYPNKFSKAVLSRMDNDGIIKVGQTVNYGDPIVLAIKKTSPTKNKLHKKKQASISDASEIWDYQDPGIVVDVERTKRGVNVTLKSERRFEVGDKVSGRFGDKGVIAAIVPDDKMPRDADGQPLEILVNDNSIVSRANPAQIFEAALGRIAAKTGKPYKIEDFEKIDDLATFVKDELQKHNINEVDDLFDPETGKKIPAVFTGNRWFMKLVHMAEDKGQARGSGKYTNLGEPAKGGDTGSKRIGLLESNSLISHGAIHTLREGSTIRGQSNPDYWMAYMQGYRPPQPKEPEVYRKFIADLKASGIDVRPGESGQLNIMALTDAAIKQLSGPREITNSSTGEFKDKKFFPKKGGLMDPSLVGTDGNAWSYIQLHTPLPNPTFEEPIRRVLGLTQKRFDDVIAGREDYGGLTGPKAIHTALKSINLEKEIAQATLLAKGTSNTRRDEAIRKLKYLEGAKRAGLKPEDWMLSRVPVLPAKFRPISLMSETKVPLIADPNYLYAQLFDANKDLKELSKRTDDVGEETAAVYQSFKALTGLADPTHPKLVEKKVKGILKPLLGSSPKMGTVQRRLISSTVDMVGRGVIVPETTYDMDTIGLPEGYAWEAYKMPVIRRLRRRGVPLIEAVRQFKNRDKLAKEALHAEMEDKPVIMSRAPVLHKFGILAYLPKLVKGNAIKVNPLTVVGHGSDMDGDAVQFHVLATDEAAKEAKETLLPSRNLFASGDFKTPMHMPGKEYVTGLYLASSRTANKPTRTFRSRKEVVSALNRNEIDPLDPVRIIEN